MKTSKFQVDGLKLEVPIEDSELREKQQGTYERKYIDWFVDNAEDITTFIDVGAFAGIYGLYMHKEEVPVIACEPSEQVFMSLENNYERNDNGTQYRLVNSAVSDSIGYLNGGVGNCYFFESKSGLNKRGTTKVKTTTLQEIGKMDMFGEDDVGLKVDTEGMELEALKGLDGFERKIKYLCVEFHPDYVDKTDIDATLDLISEYNFVPIDSADPHKGNPTIRYEKGG